MLALVTKLVDRLARKPGALQMPSADIDVITQFALGDETLRADAIAAHHRNITIVGVRGNLPMRFMAEIDTPVPDLMLRDQYRSQIQKLNLRAAA